MNIRLLVVCVGLLATTAVYADDWPQFQGPDRSNVSKEKGLLDKWPMGGPKLLWTFDKAGDGYSSPAIVGEFAYITGADKTDSHIICIEVKTGKEKWRTKLSTRFGFKGNQWGDGPRAAPSVVDGLVYALDGDGEFVCVNAETGKEAWRVSLTKVYSGQVNPVAFGGKDDIFAWGFSAAPLVDGDQVVIQCGGPKGNLLALNRKTGDKIWQSLGFNDQASYAAPVAADIGGVHQYIVLVNRGVAGIDAKTGKELWFHAKSFTDVLIPTPIVDKNFVYVNNGMDSVGCELIEVTAAGGKFTTKKVYNNKNMKSINGGLAQVDGHIYGYSDKRGWIAQDFAKGAVKWSNKNDFGSGTLTAAEGHLYLYGEDDGMVMLIEADPAAWKDKGSFTIPKKTANKSVSGKNWTYPVVANGRLCIRDQELLFCYDIKK